MTRKHYILLAEALKACDASSIVIAHIASVLVKDNPCFDTQHFVEVITGQRALHSKPSRKLIKF